MRINEIIEEADEPDMSRRGFLGKLGKGLAAAGAVAAGVKAGDAQANSSNVIDKHYDMLVGAIFSILPNLQYLEKDPKHRALFDKIENLRKWYTPFNKTREVAHIFGSPNFRSTVESISDEINPKYNRDKREEAIKACYYVYEKYIVPYARQLASVTRTKAPV